MRGAKPGGSGKGPVPVPGATPAASLAELKRKELEKYREKEARFLRQEEERRRQEQERRDRERAEREASARRATELKQKNVSIDLFFALLEKLPFFGSRNVLFSGRIYKKKTG